MVRLVLMSGALRSASMNSAMIRAAQRIAVRHLQVEAATILALHDFPPFDEDVEIVGDPLPVSLAKLSLADADGILIASPEYNGAMSGVLKNALDWLSRPWGNSSLTAKPVAMLSASPGLGGGRGAQAALWPVLQEIGADVVQHDLVAVSGAPDLFDATGEVCDHAVLGQISMLTSALVARCVDVRSSVGASPSTRHSP